MSVPAPPGGGSGGLISYTLSTPLTQCRAYQFNVSAVFQDGSIGQPGESDDFTVSTAPDLAGPPTPVGPSALRPPPSRLSNGCR